ncbi:hypothetical protein [Streptomyces canus]|uniref:hypothetical protein n=1 Tax=Streptomyces canus TaxID=58343 RepID=UPI0033AE8F2A
MTTSPPPDRVTTIYDALDAFQREYRTIGGLQHAQIRALLAEHLDRALPAAAAGVSTAIEPVCVCGHPMRLHHEDVCLTECGCNDGRESEDTDLPDRLAAALTARFTELGNPYSAMRRHEQGPDGWPASHPVGPKQVADVLRELLTAPAAVGAPHTEEAGRG